VNVSVPKIEKDYSLYRTYVIFRTLGLRHLVVVDVHNHVVGIITRKDLMPFNMQERLESLLEQTTTDDDGKNGANSDTRRKSADSARGPCDEESYADEKTPTSADDAHSDGRDVARPSVDKNATTANKTTTLDGLEEEEGTDDDATATAADEAGDGDADNATAVQLVVSAAPKLGKSEWV